MILERRAYEIDAGSEAEFWAVQRDWHWPTEIGDFFNHLVGYFETTEPGAKQIVHLYRYASLADWEARYQALYKRFPPHLFTVVRKLLSAQQNTFMAQSPIGLSGIPDLDQAAGPPRGYDRYGGDPPSGLVVQETVTDFLPGGLFVHWDALAAVADASATLSHNLIGMFQAISGRLHRKYEYRWFLSREEAIAHREEAAADRALSPVRAASEPMTVGSTIRYLRPAPFAWLRPLFQPMDWERFEARDPSARRISKY